MEPLLLTLKGKSAYKNFKPSPSDTFIYCLEGEISLMLGDKAYHASQGDALYSNPATNFKIVVFPHPEGPNNV